MQRCTGANQRRQRCPRPIPFFVAAKENGSASSGRSGRRGPHPILIFVAAKKNGFACSGRCGNEVRIRFHSSLPRRRMVPPAERRRNASVHRFLISGPNLGIDVKISPKTTFFMHRFLISSPDLRIDARISPKTTFCVHRFLISGSDLRIDAGKPMQI